MRERRASGSRYNVLRSVDPLDIARYRVRCARLYYNISVLPLQYTRCCLSLFAVVLIFLYFLFFFCVVTYMTTEKNDGYNECRLVYREN